MTSLRTPLSRARGLGSAKEGLRHWWMQRLTSLALIPLVLWFAFSVALLPGLDRQSLLDWIRAPAVTVLLLLLIPVVSYHMQLGLQVIVEDYIHTAWMKLTGLVVIAFTAIVLGLIGILAVLKIVL